MKDKILTALRAAIGKNSSINDKTLAAFVAIIEDKITDENQISEAIKPHIEFLKEVQGNVNSVAAAAASAKETELRAKPAVPPAPKAEDGKATGSDDLAALIAAEVAKAVQPINKELEGYKAKETAAARANLITSTAQKLGLPEWRVNQGFLIAEDADEAAITAALSAVKQDLVTAGLDSGNRFPLMSDDKATKEEVDKIVAGMNV